MDVNIIKKAGLTDSQAKAYVALIEHPNSTPAKLATYINETRTNTYAIIDKLLKYGIISKKDDVKYGAKYNANHPSALETLAENRRKILAKNEKQVKDNLNELINYFYEHSEMPGMRTLQGIEGIKEVYNDTIKSSKEIYLIRTTADTPAMGEWLLDYREKRKAKEIVTYALTPINNQSIQNIKNRQDEVYLFKRTILPDEAYTAPVEINIYDNKVALIAFGKDAMAIIIDSPPIALAFKQLFELMSQYLEPYSNSKKNEILLATQS